MLNTKDKINLQCLCTGSIALSLLLITGGTCSNPPVSLPATPTAETKQFVRVDTSKTSVIPPRPCNIYDWFTQPDSTGRAKLQRVNIQHIGSLHALTCQWATMTQELSLDSTRVPRYVEVMSDTLRIAEDAFAYAVRMTPTGDSPSYIPRTIFLVGEVGDSLYYRDFGDEYSDPRDSSRLTVRDMRLMDVPGADTQYFWAEMEVNSTYVSDRDTTNWTSWQGHILTYDSSRGIRHLELVNVRGEKYVNGEFRGMEQWDISVPKPGVMVVTVRERKGNIRWAPLDQLGRHVIDPTVVKDEQNH